MRPTPWLLAEPYRQASAGPYSSSYGSDFGAFLALCPDTHGTLRILASAGDEEMLWEHVSVSCANRCPNWPEMAFVKSLFWGDDETVMQLHVPKAEHVNAHAFCLHLWRPRYTDIPRPPQIAVG